ncbi:hypothetical protein CCMSSC00406_0002398 [Pleurotus cornucopiae]|uniref:Uncharacterized protein n=1 Tax=Pleurotus cornucopiae TaxID=5321 RepID=A0ACB7IRW7_PLECO|nr:hypothetical protein CCMSSC00406_0002398 [Pleurotus cornucopiae]
MSPHYDFVVVGGGTAGNSLNPVDLTKAYKLSRSHFSMFLYSPLRGSSGTTQRLHKLPLRGGLFPIPGTRFRRLFFYGMTFTRGSAEDYDKIANITGDKGWSWNRLQHYIKKHERWSSPAASPMFYDPSVHGFHGMTELTLSRIPHSIDDIILNATQVNKQFPFNVDYNSGKSLGFGNAQ